jgi:hypothetical protein
LSEPQAQRVAVMAKSARARIRNSPSSSMHRSAIADRANGICPAA